MQMISGVAAWGQMDFAPEAEGRQQNAESATQQGDAEKKKVQEKAPGKTQKEKRDSYEPSNLEMFRYLELMKNERSSVDKQRQAQSDELKALKIARNIMRGKKVPPQDESFLLTKNFKMYMAAKNVASMMECTGTAKSELGSEGGASASGGASSGGNSSGSMVASGSVSAGDVLASGGASFGSVAVADNAVPLANADGLATGIEGDIEEGLVEDIEELAVAEELRGAGADAKNADGLFSTQGKTAAELFSSNSRGTDYSTLLEGMKANGSISRGSGISHSTSTKKKKRKRYHYNFKEISVGITTAKTSGNARQVLAQARKRCAELRKELKGGVYDEEAIQLALAHAEAMERVAHKKVKHLEEEEAASKGGLCAGDMEEEDRAMQQMQDEQLRYDMKALPNSEVNATGATGMTADGTVPISEDVSMEELMAEAVQTPVLDITGDMEELMEDFNELMEDTLEEVANVNELAEEMLSGGGKTLDPIDLEEMKRKHRSEEQRAIAEADSKYLKAFFNKLQREQQAIASGASKIAAAMNSGGGMISLASAIPTSSTARAAASTGTVETTAATPTEVIQAAATKVSVEAAGTAATPSAEPAVSINTAAPAVASFDVSI